MYVKHLDDAEREAICAFINEAYGPEEGTRIMVVTDSSFYLGALPLSDEYVCSIATNFKRRKGFSDLNLLETKTTKR